MNDTVEFLIRHGAMVLFVALLIEQVGLPFPATPVLLFAEALVGSGKLDWAPVATFTRLGTGTLALTVALFAAYVGYKYLPRQRLLREPRVARVTPKSTNHHLSELSPTT